MSFTCSRLYFEIHVSNAKITLFVNNFEILVFWPLQYPDGGRVDGRQMPVYLPALPPLSYIHSGANIAIGNISRLVCQNQPNQKFLTLHGSPRQLNILCLLTRKQ